MKVLIVFVISLLGLVVHSDEIMETLSSPLHAELVKKFGNEKCENEKIGELSKDHVKCTQAINREDISEDYCPILEEIIKCLKPFNECYTDEEVKYFKMSNFEFEVEYQIQALKIDPKTVEKLKNCQLYKDYVIGGEISISMIIIGCIIAAVFVILVFSLGAFYSYRH